MKKGDQIVTQVPVTVEGNYHVVVCGGGTSGCLAAIAAARNGAKVALIESSHFLGGMISAGNAGLTKFIISEVDAEQSGETAEKLRTDPDSVQVAGGLPMEITHRLIREKNARGTYGTGASYVYTDSQEFKILLYEMMMEEKVHVMFHSMLCDLLLDGHRVKGTIVQTKLGRQVLLADLVVDCTGDGDAAAMAGVPYCLGVGADDAVYKQGLAPLGELQNIGSMFRIGGVDFDRFIDHLRDHPEAFQIHNVGLMSLEAFIRAYYKGEMIIGNGVLPDGKHFQVYNYPRKGIMIGCISLRGSRNGLNTDELTQAEYDIMIEARNLVNELKAQMPGFENAFVLDTPQAGVRETRHFKGVYNMNLSDIFNSVDFEDSIGRSSHRIDIKPFPQEYKNMLMQSGWYYHIPYRSLIPVGVNNMLLAGRCICSTREVAGCTRVTVACMVTGEAAGTAAAICIKNGVDPRELDVKALRAKLAEQGVKL